MRKNQNGATTSNPMGSFPYVPHRPPSPLPQQFGRCESPHPCRPTPPMGRSTLPAPSPFVPGHSPFFIPRTRPFPMHPTRLLLMSLLAFSAAATASAADLPNPLIDQRPDTRPPPPGEPIALADLRARDASILPLPATGDYLMYFSVAAHGPAGRPAVVAYRSADLKTWRDRTVVFETPATWWADRTIWAPEIHAHAGKYYLFLTFDSTHALPEQWPNWLPRVRRASQVLVADSPLGPFAPFANAPTLPPELMTLDGTLWIEDGVPHMVFCHEWVQIKDGTINAVALTPDLSATAGDPFRLFHGSDAPWVRKNADYGSTVTDGPALHRTASGTLLMLWSSFGAGGYTVGIAESTTGRLAGPWKQHPATLYTADGGHPWLFRRHDGHLMLALHTPSKPPHERMRFFPLLEQNNTLSLAP